MTDICSKLYSNTDIRFEGLHLVIDNLNLNSMASSDNTAPNASRRLADNYASAYTDFAPYGSACIYRTGPHWPQRQADLDCGYTLGREARPVYNHPITSKWLHIGERIFKRLDSRGVLWSVINPIAYAYDGESKPFCPLLISIGVTPGSLPYDVAYATAHESKGILVSEGFPEIDVAIVEYVLDRHCSTTPSEFLPFTSPRIHALVKPFTMLLGLPIALREHPHLMGTGGLIFHLGKDASGNPIIGLLTCAHVALPPSVYGAEYKGGHIIDESSSPIQYIAPGEGGYNGALAAIKNFVEDQHSLVKHYSTTLENTKASLVSDEEGGQLGKDSAQQCAWHDVSVLVQTNISDAETLRTKIRTDYATPSQQLLGSLLYAAQLQISSPERFTEDWAIIEMDQTKIHQSPFMCNKIYVGASPQLLRPTILHVKS